MARLDTGYEWIALSVTTIGMLLASIQGSAMLIALPDILAKLNTRFITIMLMLLGYLLVTTVLVLVIGRFADIVGRKKLFNLGFIIFIIGSILASLSNPIYHG